MNAPFEFRGINHLALVSSDMARTIEFYEGLLGMPLIKTIDLPFGMGQHFFFDCGNGDSLAFFWFPNAAPAAPGVSAPDCRPDQGDASSAHGSMNHVAFSVPPEAIDGYVAKLRSAGIACTEVANHDDSEWTVSEELHDGVFVRSVYFQDPDGILLELAAWTRSFDERVRHEPASSRPAALTGQEA
jgi:catechol 2,3-dioxygenase-like lactoylglutathione lyase family enzyme